MRRFVLAFLIVLTCGRAFGQEYVEVRTPNFTVITDAGEAQGRELAEHFQQVRSAFGIFFNKQSMTLPVPLTFVAFKNSRDFQQFVPKFTDKSHAPWPGAVRNSEDENLIAFEISTAMEGRRPTSVLTGREFADREYVKLLINGNFPRVPAWYEDGVLEYCAALHVTSKQLIYGVPQADLLTVLQAQPWLRAIQLFGPAPAAADDWEAQRHSILYAQSWITMHYLMSANLGRQLTTFLDMLQSQHIEVQEAIRRAFGVEPKAFENAVRNYVTLGITEYKLTLPPDFGKGSFETRRLREPDWMAVEGDLHYHSARDHDLGVEMYNKVLATDANNAFARRGLGFAFLQRNEFDKARSQLEKALTLAPDDARTYYLLALMDSKASKVTGGTVDFAAVKEYLQKAIALYADYADAYQLLSWAESELKNIDAAHTDIEKASELMPRNDFFALTSAQYDLQAKQFDRARPVLERLQSSEQPEVARFAHQALANLGPAKAATTSTYSPRQQITDPRWQPKDEKPEAAEEKSAPAAAAPVAEAKQKIEFLKGELVSVDCTKAPMVTITVMAKGKNWLMYSRDVQKLMLIGVENFSCDWTNKKASVNYRLQADGRGEIISLEID